MMRSCLCAALTLALSVGFTLAEAPKKAKNRGAVASGAVKKFDAATGVLTVAVKVKKQTEDKEFKLTDGVEIFAFGADGKQKKLSGKEGHAELKDGVAVAVVSDEAGKIVAVRVGTPPKPKFKNAAGTIKKFDAASATLTVTVKGKKNTTEDKEFKLTDNVSFVVFAAEGKPKKTTGKDGFGDLKDGTPVVVQSDDAGKVVGVRVGTPQRKQK